MDKLDMFQAIFEKIDEFGWWDLEITSAGLGTQFTSTEVQDECQAHGVWIALAYLEYQEIDGQVEVTWQTFGTISHSLMVHAQFSEAYIHFSLMYTADHVFPVLTIKDLINEDGETTTSFKLATGKRPSILHLRIYFVHLL